MQLFVTVADPLAGDRVDLVADVDGRTPVAALGEQLQALLRDSADRSGSAVLYVDGQPVDPGETVADSPIREGSLISLGDPAGCVPPEPRGIAEVRVIAGPDAGRVFRLGVGSGELGRDPGCWVVLGDPGLAPFAALLTVDAEARCWITPAPESALSIEDDPVEGRTEWIPGLVLTAAGSLLPPWPALPRRRRPHPDPGPPPRSAVTPTGPHRSQLPHFATGARTHSEVR